mgnify:CR=1 FL=1
MTGSGLSPEREKQLVTSLVASCPDLEGCVDQGIPVPETCTCCAEFHRLRVCALEKALGRAAREEELEGMRERLQEVVDLGKMRPPA